MTDVEIVKALEICSTTGGKCTDCPAFVKVDRSNCKKAFKGAVAIINRQKEELTKNEKIIKAANDLIVCQKAEIERLKQNLEEAHIDIKEHQAHKGIIRKIDDLGRIAIPKDYRRRLGIKEGQDFEIVIVNDFIVIGKARAEEMVGEG